MTIFGVLWQGRPTPVMEMMRKVVRQAVEVLVTGDDARLLLPA
jgi:predicted phosphohydrolase